MDKRIEDYSGGFGVTEVSRLTGINRVTLHVWDKSGFLAPSLIKGGRGTGNRRRYSFDDLVALRVARRLRDEGVSLGALRKIARYLKKTEEAQNPLASSYLALQGRDVVMIRGEEVVSVLAKPGQYTLLLKLDLAAEASLTLARIGASAA